MQQLASSYFLQGECVLKALGKLNLPSNYNRVHQQGVVFIASKVLVNVLEVIRLSILVQPNGQGSCPWSVSLPSMSVALNLSQLVGIGQ
jgi:hypothetical protein